MWEKQVTRRWQCWADRRARPHCCEQECMKIETLAKQEASAMPDRPHTCVSMSALLTRELTRYISQETAAKPDRRATQSRRFYSTTVRPEGTRSREIQTMEP